MQKSFNHSKALMKRWYFWHVYMCGFCIFLWITSSISKINSVVVKKRIPLSFHVLRETWSPLCVYISVWMSVRVKSFPWLHKEPKNIYFDVRLCWSKAFKWKLPLLKLIIRDIKTFLPFEEKEMILGSCCELTDNS